MIQVVKFNGKKLRSNVTVISLCQCYLEEVLSAISIFDEALNQLHKICLRSFKYRLICLRHNRKEEEVS